MYGILKEEALIGEITFRPRYCRHLLLFFHLLLLLLLHLFFPLLLLLSLLLLSHPQGHYHLQCILQPAPSWLRFPVILLWIWCTDHYTHFICVLSISVYFAVHFLQCISECLSDLLEFDLVFNLRASMKHTWICLNCSIWHALNTKEQTSLKHWRWMTVMCRS